MTKHNPKARVLKQYVRYGSEERANLKKYTASGGRHDLNMRRLCILAQLSIVAYLIGDANVDKDAVDKVTRKTAL